ARGVIVVPQFIQIVMPEQKQVFAAAVVNKPANDQIDVFRENSSLQRDPVANVPTITFCKTDAGKSRRPLFHEGIFLFWREWMNVRINAKEAIVVDGKLSEKVRRIFVDAADPLIRADLDDSGGLPDLFPVRDGQRIREGGLMARQDPGSGFRRKWRTFQLF